MTRRLARCVGTLLVVIAAGGSRGLAQEAPQPGPLSGQLFKLAAAASFDPQVFPLVGVATEISRGSGVTYERRYSLKLADRTVSNFMTLAVVPVLVHQDPRYVPLSHGSPWHRAAYALSRTVVARSSAGQAQFNYSEIGGGAISAALSNAYRAPSERTFGGSLTSMGMQLMWHGVSNEVKEFWPDIHRRLRRPSSE